MKLIETLKPIGHGHEGPPESFINLVMTWGRQEHEEVFAPNDHLGDKDIYNIVYHQPDFRACPEPASPAISSTGQSGAVVISKDGQGNDAW